jgi:murein DD-endopeptidase MepM/ murein hydrolase activator NlpD
MSVTPTLRFHPARANLISPDAIPWGSLPHASVPVHFTLRPGETLASVLSDLGLPDEQGYAATRAAAELTDLRRLRSGDSYAVFFERDVPVSLHLPVRDEGRVELTLESGEWQASFREYTRSLELQAVRGTLEGYLEGSIRRAGGDAGVAYLMSDVLQWDLDFNRDLQAGDSFEVLYERVYLDGEFHDLGRVLALTYESGDRRLTAYQYGDDSSYYDAEGRPLQKMFLRSPLRYSRVTSSFSARRFHPVLKTYRPHYGVDYGAPAGTPVRVTASGVVRSAAWENGGGRTVRVRHANGYMSAYLHLSGFAKGITSGARVSQGQVVGYVGATGLATAPHLDYRVQLAGRWINPLSLQNDPAPPIAEEELPDFYAWRDTLDRGLATGVLGREILAAASPRARPTVGR